MEKYIVKNDTEFGRALNRCIENRCGQIVLAKGAMITAMKLYAAAGSDRMQFEGDGLHIMSEDIEQCAVGFVAIENARNVFLSYLRTLTNSGRNSFNIVKSSDIWMTECVANSSDSVGVGVNVRGCQNVNVGSSTIENVGTGVAIMDSEGVVFEANTIRKTAKDCVNIGNNVEYTAIEHNLIMGQEAVTDEDHHYDLIQLWVRGDATKSTKHISIRNNRLIAMGPSPTPQAIFGRADYGTNPAKFENLEICGNTIVTRHAHGISIKDVDRILVLGNTLIYGGRDNPKTVNIPGILLSGDVKNATVEWNVVPKKPGYSTDFAMNNTIYDLRMAG